MKVMIIEICSAKEAGEGMRAARESLGGGGALPSQRRRRSAALPGFVFSSQRRGRLGGSLALPCWGFTLIELLAVIAIIAIVAGMIVGLAPGVNQNKKRQRVQVELTRLEGLIDSYKQNLGHYPPDNPALSSGTALTAEQYDSYTQINSLLYELTGGTNNASQTQASQPGGFYWTSWGTPFDQAEIGIGYGVKGILNSDAEQRIIYKPLPLTNSYMPYPKWAVKSPVTVNGQTMIWPGSSASAKDLQGLIVPVDMVQADDPANAGHPDPATMPVATRTNYWHFDASSPNRHNVNSYDLWAEFVVGKKSGAWLYQTNGNW